MPTKYAHNQIFKVVIIGPESTGKSTLTQALADHYRSSWADEYARSYIELLDRPYAQHDLLTIAKGQIALEETAIKNAKNGLTFLDTNLYVIKVWSEHKYASCDKWIEQQIHERSYDLYLLTDTDLPWTYDPQREYPDLSMRRYFFNLYEQLVQQSGTPWAIIKGNEQERLRAAIAAIAAHLNK
jgi:NadR type nicotinamide-nucleotide adenylyltransferase